ncbi:MAG: site-specific integrase [Selenomonadaceae bacterium]|nr:site-specific integrase [Selenomonadaceae bacterium]MDY2686120.1 site-specific integrase [Selenomonadaceae bacterium]
MVKKTKNGKWRSYFRYKDGLGRSMQKKREGFTTKREAEAWEREWRVKHEGRCTPGITFKDLAIRYFADQEARNKASSLRSLKCIYRKHLAPTFADMECDAITPAMIREWQNSMIAKNLKPATISKIQNTLSRIFYFAVHYLGLASNPCTRTPLRFTVPKRTYTIWTQEQFETFCGRLPTESGREYVFLLFLRILFYSGMRRGEALALLIRDIDFQNGTIHINKTRYPSGKATSPKTDCSIRNVTMPSEIMTEIHAYIERIYNADADTPLFPPFTSINAIWARSLEDYAKDLPKIRLHDLRHSHASMLLAMGFTAQEVADRLGHANAGQVIKTYGHIYNDHRRREIANKLQCILEKDKS